MNEHLTSATSLHGTLWTGRERDACGTGFVAELDGTRVRRTVELALDALERIAHRGAVDAGDGDGEPTGDGAGVLTQIPWDLLTRELPACAAAVDARRAGVATCFLPRDDPHRARELIEAAARGLGHGILGWRTVPVVSEMLGSAARATLPVIEQLVVEVAAEIDVPHLNPALYRLRRQIEHDARAAGVGLYIASCSSTTIVYKGLVVGHQLRGCFPDLSDADYRSAIAVFHQRYSTNTFPAWERAQPCRTIAHNGEINTLHGNTAWMWARGANLGWPAGTAGADDGGGTWLLPVIDESGSDSAMLDDAVQLLTHGGRALPEALTMLLPPAWDHDQDVHEPTRELLRAYAAATEPWDGPAAIAFTDGSLVGASLDRNGLRPARWLRTDDGLVACASETGAVPIPPEHIISSGRLGPGQMLLVDIEHGTVRHGDQVIEELAASEAWDVRVAAQQADVNGGIDEDDEDREPLSGAALTARHALFGYTREELTAVVRPMLQTGLSPVGSMGDDTPIAPLATQPRSLFAFARQGFAEVTNPPIDPLRERASMSLDTIVGPRPPLLAPEDSARVALRLRSPIITDAGMARIRDVADQRTIRIVELSTCIERHESVAPSEVEAAVEALCVAASEAVDAGADVIVLTDRAARSGTPALPALLVGSAVHQRLLSLGQRTAVGLVQESGEVREAHHLAALIGHGIDAVCPWLALATARDLATGPRSRLELDASAAQSRLVDALHHGLLTAMSRMGISTVGGYRGTQIFESVGLDPAMVGRHLHGTIARPGSIGWAWVAEQLERQSQGAAAWEQAEASTAEPLPSPGFYKFKRGGEQHGFEPAMVAALHDAVRVEDPLGAGFAEAMHRYRAYSSLVREHASVDVRDLLDFDPHGASGRAAVPLEEVESARELVRRFSTGAMSHGSLGSEAHETLAEAMNMLGAWSNSGEGGEDISRFGTSRNSAIKQVASGRFGVTPAYLRSARELQIKIAQGSKPGEGGHLPGDKVTDEIARIRHTLPGVSLISPPPHHDIYSIEDLAQLLHDLASINPRARLSVKLVSQAGVGTIAAGVAKARAMTIVISGSSGGTGASPLGSIKQAGMPWEWGLAETQQVLVANRLRGRVRLRVDGGLRTGRDVLIAALLGADEFSFGTAALIAEGCKMARTCHNDQCPVGIATQRADLRALFPGQPEQVATFLLLVAEEVRELLAMLGARKLDDVIGRPELLRPRSAGAAGDGDAVLDLGALLARPDVPSTWPRRDQGEPNLVPGLDDGLDARLARDLWPSVVAARDGDRPVTWRGAIANTDRSVGARLSGDIAERLDPAGLAPGSVRLEFTGTAGQSFGAFAIRGLRLGLEGEANDFVGKGLAGADIDVRFPDASARAAVANEHVLLGNACLYGATSGSLLAAGIAGERFAVRNSGADAVVEGAGDHVCEYMTGGTVVVLGHVGRNVASGMSGGLLWVLDDRDRLERRLAKTAQLVDPTEDEIRELLELVERHAERTGSLRAHVLLADWDAALTYLHCIAPLHRVTVPAAATA